MKFDTKTETNVEQVGDIKNNNVSIDTSNIDFIVTILSTSLYSKPIESFIRETVSNAWDSHIEAGVDEPVILELGKDTEGNKFCRIQDFGVGLSPERFDSVYKNIGSSTKRSDNTQIGGFGIGRFSALAYSEVVHITSVHEGKKYLYMMYKDGNTVSIDMLHSSDTEERNGLEVKLPIKEGDYENFTKAIKSQLVYFENLFIIDSTTSNIDNLLSGVKSIEEEYNKFSLKKYNNFWVNNLDKRKELNLVLGKVRYPVRIENLDKIYSNKISEYPISLRFDIGDLDVTPNREEILYSDKNKKNIQDKLDLAILEIDELISQEKSKDYTNIPEYIEAINNKQYLYLLNGDYDQEDLKVKIKLSDSKRNLTLNGEKFRGKVFSEMYKAIMALSVINPNYNFRNQQIKYYNGVLSLDNIKSRFENIFIGDIANIKNITKRYIRENFNDDSYFIKDDKSILNYVKTYVKRLKSQARENKLKNNQGYAREFVEYDHRAFKVIVKYILGNISKIKRFNDNTVPNSWIIGTKAKDKAKRGVIKKQGFDWKQNINMHELRTKDYGGVMTDSKAYVLKDLKTKFKALTIYAEKDNSKLRTLFTYLKSEVKPNMIELAPTKVKLLEKIDNFVKIEDFMTTDYTLLRNIATVEFLKREMPFLKEVAKIRNINKISEKLAGVIDELSEFVYKYESKASRHADANEEQKLIEEIYSVAQEKDFFNEHVRGLFNSHKKELLNSKLFIEFIGDGGRISHHSYIPENRINLIVDYVLVRKLIRPTIKSVFKLKQETIFNIKEENEDNQN